MFFHVFIETATFPELKTVFSFTIDPLGAEKTPICLGFLTSTALLLDMEFAKQNQLNISKIKEFAVIKEVMLNLIK